jgi:streptogramin lyase
MLATGWPQICRLAPLLATRSFLAAVVALAVAGTCSAASADVGTISEYPIPTANSTPRGITTGPDGRLWFTENMGNKIGRITTAGQIGAGDEIALPTPFVGPSGITTGPDGNLWFTETAGGANSRVGRIPPNASSSADVLEIAVPTPNSSPEGITAGPDGRIWFTEFGTDGGRIGVLATNATQTTDITEFGISGGVMTTLHPVGIVSGPGAKLWFTAFGNDVVGRVAPPGADVPTTDQFPTGDGPQGITVGPDGNLWAADQLSNQITRVTPDGTATNFPTFTSNRQPFGIAAGPDGRIWFTEMDGSTNHIGVMTTDGVMTAADEFTIPTDNANPLYITAGPDNRMWFTEANGNKIGAITTGVAPPSGGGTTPPPGPGTPPPGSGPQTPSALVPVGCAPNKLILTDVFPKGGRTRLMGVAPRGSAGKRLTIVSTWNGKTVARTKVAADLTFAVAAPLPPARLRSTNRARYVAKLGSRRSHALKFARRMYTTAVSNQGRRITFSGTVTRPLDKPPRPVVIRASASCSTIGSGTIVATVKPSSSGAFTARFDLPAGMMTAFLRAQTRVRKHAGSKTTFPTFTLVRGIKLAP